MVVSALVNGFLAALLVGLVELESNVDCPTAQDVAERLTPLLPTTPRDRQPDLAIIDRSDTGFKLRLFGSDRRLLAERRLQSRGCAEAAAEAAVIVATWESEATSVPSPLAMLRPLPPAVRAEVAAAFVSSLAGFSFAPGGLATVTLLSGRRPFGGRLELAGFGSRSIDLAPGSFEWTRAWIGLGPVYRYQRGRALIDVHAQLMAALLWVRGNHVPNPMTAYDLDPGVAAGARAALRLGPTALFLSVAFAGWPRQQQVHVDNLPGSASLPRFEVLLGVGFAVGSYAR